MSVLFVCVGNSGRSVLAVREIREEIAGRVDGLVRELDDEGEEH